MKKVLVLLMVLYFCVGVLAKDDFLKKPYSPSIGEWLWLYATTYIQDYPQYNTKVTVHSLPHNHVVLIIYLKDDQKREEAQTVLQGWQDHLEKLMKEKGWDKHIQVQGNII